METKILVRAGNYQNTIKYNHIKDASSMSSAITYLIDCGYNRFI